MTDLHTLLCIEPGEPSNGGRPFILRPITCDVKVQTEVTISLQDVKELLCPA